MNTFKILGYIILSMIVAFLIGAFFLPNQVKITHSREIKAPIDSVFAMVNDFHNWSDWSPWYDTTKVYTITGSTSGAGTIMRWVDKSGQVGERTISWSSGHDSLQVVTLFREENSSAANNFYFKSVENGTLVTVSFIMEEKFGYPFGRYIAWMISAGANKSFPLALENLEKAAVK